ncbi:hypothetical protein BLNAU_8409 [Blattamonas nauphoetae]|uniref:Uncharacterized protein n=1 Tax=Blattamonas nauphoetae TaxID=2049346 RepID=A0ABQ9XYN2_9EUKA|nr:hypothetical protein BLNAU_8409 [Blattamonas nauphoetae]
MAVDRRRPSIPTVEGSFQATLSEQSSMAQEISERAVDGEGQFSTTLKWMADNCCRRCRAIDWNPDTASDDVPEMGMKVLSIRKRETQLSQRRVKVLSGLGWKMSTFTHLRNSHSRHNLFGRVYCD